MAISSTIYSPDGVYRSPRPKVSFPTDPSLSMISFLFRNTTSYPNRLAIAEVESTETLTFNQLRSSVYSTAAGLQRLGISKGSVILIFAPNSIEFAVSFFAIVASGAIATTVNPLYTVSELSKQAKDSGAKFVFTVPQLWDKVKDLHLPTIFMGTKLSSEIFAAEVPIRYFSDLKSVPEAEYFPPEIKQSDIAALLYSSGTTGANKGVILTHRNFICTSMMATGDQDLLDEPPNTFLCFLPLFHIFGLSVITYAQLQRGNSLVLMAKFDLEKMMRSIEKYRVSYSFVVPPVMIALAKQANLKKYDLSSMKLLGSGAAPLGKDVMEEVAKSLPGVEVIQVRFLFGGN